MNIITASDKKKFIRLLKAGLAHGSHQEMQTNSQAVLLDGTDIPKEYCVGIYFVFKLPPNVVKDIIDQDQVDEEIKDMLTGL